MLEVAEEVVGVEFRAPQVEEIDTFDEAFLTSASRGIIPVISIDGVTVGRGVPDGMTRILIEHYNQRARSFEESL
jgi:D-alanine transaminase